MDETEMRDYLEMMAKIRKRPLQDGPFDSYEDLVLQHGVLFPNILQELPKGMRYGAQKHCFYNAFRRGTDGSFFEPIEGLTYCEGYAQGLIIVHHAWLVDQNGNVIDPTWREKGTCYFGIPFDWNYVKKSTLERSIYGAVLDNYQQGHPLLTQAGAIDAAKAQTHFRQVA
jgi:hypothetical protein